jgi:Flp pilus assembly protein TadD
MDAFSLQPLYTAVIRALQSRITLNQVEVMKPLTEGRGERGEGRRRIKARLWVSMFAFLSVALLVSPLTPRVLAWSWDEEEVDTKDELEVQLEGYRKRVESGISLQERIVLLDRLIKLYKVRGRDTKALEEERAQALADEAAVQTVSAASRQKAQSLFQQAMEQIKAGTYKQAQTTLQEAEHLNPTDKILSDLRQKMDAVTAITPQAPLDPNSGDLVRRGVMQFAQNEPSKSLNFLLYAQQKDPTDKSIPALVDLVKRTFPNESAEILDARLNLIDQKLQKALEKIYAGEYLVAAKECQEVLDLEPENALALTRLGSVYYAMGQVKQARVHWTQALALDPRNDVLKSFLSQTSTEADRAPAQALTYKVQKGDTLMTIAEKVYRDRNSWRKLFDANRAYLKNPYQLIVGQVLVLPPGALPPPTP